MDKKLKSDIKIPEIGFFEHSRQKTKFEYASLKIKNISILLIGDTIEAYSYFLTDDKTLFIEFTINKETKKINIKFIDLPISVINKVTKIIQSKLLKLLNLIKDDYYIKQRKENNNLLPSTSRSQRRISSSAIRRILSSN